MEELRKWVDGEYPSTFMALVVAAYRADGLIKNHSEDALARAADRRAKKHGKG